MMKSAFLFLMLFHAFSAGAQYNDQKDLYSLRNKKEMRYRTQVVVEMCERKTLPRMILKRRKYITDLKMYTCSKQDSVGHRWQTIILPSRFSKIPRWIYRLTEVTTLNFAFFENINWECELKKFRKMKQLTKLEISVREPLTIELVEKLIALEQLKTLTLYYSFPSQNDPLLKRLLQRFGENLGYSYIN